MEKGNFEKFSVYNFSLDYPPVCRIEFNPKSRHKSGDVVFHFPDKEKVFVTWGNLEQLKRNFRLLKNRVSTASTSQGRVLTSRASRGFRRILWILTLTRPRTIT